MHLSCGGGQGFQVCLRNVVWVIVLFFFLGGLHQKFTRCVLRAHNTPSIHSATQKQLKWHLYLSIGSGEGLCVCRRNGA